MYLLFVWSWTYVFGWGEIHFSGLKGWALKSRLFWAQIALGALVAISGPKKVSISGPTPSKGPRYGLLSHPNPYVPPHINDRYINSYSPLRFVNCYPSPLVQIPPSPVPVWISLLYTRIQCVRLGCGVLGLKQINTCGIVPVQVNNFFTWRHFAFAFYESYLSTLPPLL